MTWLLALAALWLAAAVVGSFFPRDLAASRYPSPEEAEAEAAALADSHPERCRVEELGRSREGRPIRALRIAGGPGRRAHRPRLLVTAQIHAVEFVGGYVARAMARRLVEEYGRDDEVTRLLDRAEVVIVPLANPDGARRVWRRRGRSGLGWARFTQGGVDPNRNFPAVPVSGSGAWNTGRDRPGSPWYRGPHPLSEPECRALAELARRERFCGSLHLHSFGCVVYLPELPATDRDAARRALDVFDGPFQLRQPFRPYRPVRERSAAIVGQLDPFLLHGLGTPSVTVEVGRPGRHLLDPRRALNLFWISNPPDPDHWASNDAGAAIHALSLLLDRSGGRPLTPDRPELADF